jgi:hypothetical protein
MRTSRIGGEDTASKSSAGRYRLEDDRRWARLGFQSWGWNTDDDRNLPAIPAPYVYYSKYRQHLWSDASRYRLDGS